MADFKTLGRLSKRKMESFLLLVKELNKSKYFCGGGSIVTNTLLLSHALEKGMGINNVRLGYGKEKAKKLIIYLEQLPDKNSFEYYEGLAVIDAYLEFQRQHGVDVSEIEQLLLNKNISLTYPNTIHGGFKWIKKEELEKGREIDFTTFVESRHSIRKFSTTEILPDELNVALSIASHAPSACNRQPYKFFFTLDPEKNLKLSKMIPGNKSFSDDIPYYGLIVSDRNSFTTPEAFQWYVNGGIFISYLTLAFHHLGIGSCIFQWPAFYKDDSKARHLCSIKDSQIIIAAIGYGKYPDQAKCIEAQRKTPVDISAEF